MEVIDRYIYAVVKKLPESQKEDIGKELQSLIEDMLIERYGSVDVDISNIEEVLIELGEPSLLANKYRNKERYLIGPEYYDLYTLVLKIVAVSVLLGVIIAKGVELFVNQPTDVIETIFDFFNAIFYGIIGGFAWVTVIFAVIENKIDIKETNINKQKWKPTDLPSIPKGNSKIKKVEPIASIIFIGIFIFFINIVYNLVGAYIFTDDKLTIIPLFSDFFKQMLPLITISLSISIIKECLKLISGKWTIPLSISCSLINIIAMIINVVVFANPDIWNMNFILEIENSGNYTAETIDVVSKVWHMVTGYFVHFIVIVGILEVVGNIVNGLKNRE